MKIVYHLNNELKKQLYNVDVFLFFDALLEPVKSEIYNSVWRVVRLHTPKVCDLAGSLQPEAPITRLHCRHVSVQAHLLTASSSLAVCVLLQRPGCQAGQADLRA